jgi:phospholipase A1/A2
MNKLILILISTICFAEDISKIYQDAQNLEKEGNFKEAMYLYKKAANLSMPKEDKYILDLTKNEDHKVDTFSNMKKDFYTTQIDKLGDNEANESLKQILAGDFNLYPYKKNYLLPVTYDLNKSSDRKQFETAYQISVEKPISYNFFGLNESISAAYTQKSFWQTSKDSSPFRETNYMPEIFIQFPYKNSDTLKGYKISLLHESNGRNNEFSRSWNRIYAEAYLQLSSLFIIPKVWYRIPENEKDDDNPNIDEYYGYGDLTFLYAYKRHTFELTLRDNLRLNSQNKGSAEFNWAFPLPEFLSTNRSYGLLQIFSGYGNSLIDYDREVNKIGLGIAFSR